MRAPPVPSARPARWHPALALAALVTLLPGCARKWIALADRPTCVVLSAGGPAGLAHLGALAAVQAERVPIDCVAGTSMGALVGALYVTAPGRAPAARYTELLDAYEARTRETGVRNAFLGALVGGLIAGLASAGEPLSILGGAGAGALVAGAATPRVELDRMTEVLDGYLQGTRIEATAVPYVTFYQERAGTKLELVTARSGSLAEAVGKSIANPFIFTGFDPVKKGYVDPGADRMAATPIEDACAAFPRARILAINVTGQPSRHGKDMRCPLLEVVVPAEAVGEAALRGRGEAFDQAVALGFDHTRRALQEARR